MSKSIYLKRLNQRLTLRRILAEEKNLSDRKKEKIKERLRLLDTEILELERELKSQILPVASGSKYGDKLKRKK